MVIKIKKKAIVFGVEKELSQYYPESIPLTKERRKKADRLDEVLRKSVERINKDYDAFKKDAGEDDREKWKWVGRKIEEILKTTLESETLEQTDIDNHLIWPAIGQYLRPELKRGFDAKRSGTAKDHYRKCYLLAITPGTDWINSWIGWDAFADRGEQVVMSKKILPALEKIMLPIKNSLKAKDYQKLAKLISDQLPSGTNKPVDVDAMSDQAIAGVVESVVEAFRKK